MPGYIPWVTESQWSQYNQHTQTISMTLIHGTKMRIKKPKTKKRKHNKDKSQNIFVSSEGWHVRPRYIFVGFYPAVKG